MVHVKKPMAFIAAMILVVAVLPISAYARYSNTENIRGDIKFESDLAKCEGRVDGFVGTTKVSITLSLQKQNTNGTYTTIKTWDKVSVNNDTLTVKESYYVERGNSYRIYIEAEVTLDGKVEKPTSYSGTVKCS